MKLPTPHFVVFYNGSQEQPERKELFLSSAYQVSDENPNLELKVLVLNINHGKNQKILEQAVETAIEECIQGGILKDFLTKNRAEAKQMSIFEYHEEEVIKLIRKDEREEGCEVGECLHLVKLVCRKLVKGKTVEEIAEDLEETVERIRIISEIALFTAPNYDVEAICNKLMEQEHH